jgi:UDP:flavonoid glycosyltransferase YjiC (YdhE family)
MKVLHLFSDQNWTGPAEPVLNLCKELERLGHDVLLAYTKPVRKTERTVATKVEQRGVRATTSTTS